MVESSGDTSVLASLIYVLRIMRSSPWMYVLLCLAAYITLKKLTKNRGPKKAAKNQNSTSSGHKKTSLLQSLDESEKEKLLSARAKMQEKYEQDMKNHAEKLKQEQERKKLELEKKKAKKSEESDDKKPLKPRFEYSPLSGTGVLPSYRPQKKGCCSRGGGCG